MHRIKIFIRTLSPLVLSSTSNSTVMTETHSSLSGSVIRGIMAAHFVKANNLINEAHDLDFREIFFGGLKFLAATPEIASQRSFVLPLSLQSGKAGTSDADKVQDLLADEKPARGYKSFRGFAILDGGKFFKAQIKTNMFMHMSRSGERERLEGKSIDGAIYNYEAIDAGQNFCGEVIGDDKTLSKFRDKMNLDGGKMIAYVGRSRFTQYGKCLVTFGDVERVPAQNFSDKIFLLLDAPLIPADDCFISAEKILQTEIVDKLGEKFSLGKVFASAVEVENFVVPWGMKRPRVMALAAGTVFELNARTLTGDDKKFLAEKIFAGFGMRTEEGFGQLRLWTPSNSFTKGALLDEKISTPKNFSDDTISIAKKILTAHLLEQVRLYAHEDAEKLRPQLKRGNWTHFFSRLDNLLSSVDKKNLRENFKARLELEIRGGSHFEERLKNLRMANEQKFFDVLTCRSPLPVDSRTKSNEIEFKKLQPLLNEIKLSPEDFSSDAIHFEYLKNYFRFTRKISASSKGGEERE